jgi:acyl-coenzyme A synthetase/AMP-(fatty) acid ligase
VRPADASSFAPATRVFSYSARAFTQCVMSVVELYAPYRWYIVGRKTEIVITGGFKVSIAEVERVLMQLPGISECAVLAVPDRCGAKRSKRSSWRETAGTVPSRKSWLTAERGWAEYSPTSIEVWPELPKNPGGKIDRPRLRAQFWPDGPPRAPSAGATSLSTTDGG